MRKVRCGGGGERVGGRGDQVCLEVIQPGRGEGLEALKKKGKEEGKSVTFSGRVKSIRLKSEDWKFSFFNVVSTKTDKPVFGEEGFALAGEIFFEMKLAVESTFAVGITW